MNVYEVPKSSSEEEAKIESDLCGVNCDWGFGLGVAIAMIGPLPGPT